MSKLSKINSSRELRNLISVTGNYAKDLKAAAAKGYTFSKTVHEIMNMNFRMP